MMLSIRLFLGFSGKTSWMADLSFPSTGKQTNPGNMNVTEVYGETAANASGSHNTTALVFPETLDKTISVLSITILFITMISLGCTMEIAKIKGHFVKPKGVFIALLAQFGVMPLTAFCLTRLLALGPIASLAVLICGCCPGGSLSNIFSLALNGDMNLR